MNRDAVEIRDGLVVKKYDSHVELEYLKARALAEASHCGGFVAARPLSVDISNQIIVYEFLERLQSVRSPYLEFVKGKAGDSAALEVFRCVGRTLAAIHRKLQLGSRTEWQPSDTFRNAMRELGVNDLSRALTGMPYAFLHGDFGFSNVHRIGETGSQIAVIDCSCDNYTTFASDTYAPVYVDVAHMVACMEGLFPLSNYPFVSWDRASEIKEAFLAAYEQSSGVSLERKWVSRFAYASVASKFHKEMRSRLLRKLAVWIVFNEFKNNLPYGES